MIEIRNLTKRFGDFTAVDHLSLRIKTNEFMGLLGPNGAGKTTTISMMSTVLLPTEGEIRIDGEQLTRKAASVKRKLSVVTQEYSMRQDMTMNEVMEYQGRLYYMRKKEIRAKTQELFAFAGLSDFGHRTVRHLSGGMKRKLMICRALMVEPEILLLDEPTAGMDALARRQMWDLLRSLKERNLTILLTTHYIDEAQALCSRVAFIDGGKLDVVDAPRFNTYIIMPMSFLCNTFFSTDQMPHGIKEFVSALPLSQTSDMVRAVAQGNDPNLMGVVVLLAYLVVFAVISFAFIYKKNL